MNSAETNTGRTTSDIGRRTYIPILKGKQGERLALRDLSPAVQAAITPAFQLLPGRDDAAIDREIRQIAAGWAGISPVLVDAAWADTAATSVHPLLVVDTVASANGLVVIPVVRDGSDAGYLAAAAAVATRHAAGAALRLSPAVWQPGTAGSLIAPLCSAVGLAPAEIDLILDAGAIASDPARRLYATLLASGLPVMPDLARWRRVAVAGGSMPVDLRGIATGSVTRLPRHEWTLWGGLPAAGRRLTYADYAVAHPESLDEISNPRAIPLWAQFRYTAGDAFLIAKAGDVNRSGPEELYDVCARIAVEPEFDGPTFCAADAWIAARAARSGAAGNYTVWRRHGTSRHISKTVSLLANPGVP